MNQEIFGHETRKRIYNHILAYPGVSFNIIKSVFELTDGTLRYHLKFLESADEIKSCLEGNVRCYYPVKIFVFPQSQDAEFDTYELNHTQVRIMNNVRHNPGITQKELIIKTHLSRFTVGYHIRKLIEIGIVRQEPDGKNICYHYISNIELRKKILKKMIVKFVNHEIDEQTFLELKRKLEL